MSEPMDYSLVTKQDLPSPVISDEAREAALNECIDCDDRRWNEENSEKIPKYAEVKGHYVQLAINSATEKLTKENEELKATVKYWIEQHGIETEKRGETEHQLDLARGNLAESFESIERENQTLSARVKELESEVASQDRFIERNIGNK